MTYHFFVLKDPYNSFYLPSEDKLLGPFNIKEIDSKFKYYEQIKTAIEKLGDKNPFARKLMETMEIVEAEVQINFTERSDIK